MPRAKKAHSASDCSALGVPTHPRTVEGAEESWAQPVAWQSHPPPPPLSHALGIGGGGVPRVVAGLGPVRIVVFADRPRDSQCSHDFPDGSWRTDSSTPAGKPKLRKPRFIEVRTSQGGLEISGPVSPCISCMGTRTQAAMKCSA